MPTYEYDGCKCGLQELYQSMSADPYEKCPKCGDPVRRLISKNLTIVLKGSGWAKDGYSKA